MTHFQIWVRTPLCPLVLRSYAVRFLVYAIPDPHASRTQIGLLGHLQVPASRAPSPPTPHPHSTPATVPRWMLVRTRSTEFFREHPPKFPPQKPACTRCPLRLCIPRDWNPPTCNKVQHVILTNLLSACILSACCSAPGAAIHTLARAPAVTPHTPTASTGTTRRPLRVLPLGRRHHRVVGPCSALPPVHGIV